MEAITVRTALSPIEGLKLLGFHHVALAGFVRTALSPIEGLKQQRTRRKNAWPVSQNSAKPD